MLLKQIKGFYHKVFLLVGSYTMFSWQLIKKVSMAVYQHLNIKKHNLICLASCCYVVDKIYAQLCSKTHQARWHLTLRLLYSEGVDSVRLLLCLIACIRSLFIPKFISSAANLIFSIVMNGYLGCLNACNRKRSIYSNRTVSWIDLLTVLLEYIDLVL